MSGSLSACLRRRLLVGSKSCLFISFEFQGRHLIRSMQCLMYQLKRCQLCLALTSSISNGYLLQTLREVLLPCIDHLMIEFYERFGVSCVSFPVSGAFESYSYAN